jgi:hypothetical protein
VAEIVGAGARQAEVSIASLIYELEQARELAERDRNPAAMVSAIMGKAKLAGFLTDRKEVRGDVGELGFGREAKEDCGNKRWRRS